MSLQVRKSSLDRFEILSAEGWVENKVQHTTKLMGKNVLPVKGLDTCKDCTFCKSPACHVLPCRPFRDEPTIYVDITTIETIQ